jgi:hypothetical protein
MKDAFPQGLKPRLFWALNVRAEARTLQARPVLEGSLRLEAHFVLESASAFRLVLFWNQLHPSASFFFGINFTLQAHLVLEESLV